MSGTPPVVVVGASTAGVTTAEALRAEGCTAPVLLVGAEAHAPYGRPPLSKQVLTGAWSPERAEVRSAAALADRGITLRTSCPATALDPRNRRVALGGRWQDYAELVVATGLTARRLPGAGAGVPVLRTLDDAVRLRARLLGTRHLVVVGAGILGQEIASAARALDVAVTLVGRSRELSLGTVGALLAERLAALHREHAVDLRLGRAVLGVRPVGTRRWCVELDDGSRLTVDLVVAALGGVPTTGWLRGSGLDLADGVLCDPAGLAAPHVHAVGDVARWRDARTGRGRRVEHQTSAVEQGLAVARRLVHGTPPEPAVPFLWSELHGTRVQAYGWFPPGRSLEPLPSASGTLLAATAAGRTTGVVGWGAGRAFRVARGLVTAESPGAPGARR
ncbi:NAD(P)/FAD-dependent oxidoreductase [Microlunatus capsulatus]|uniref:NADPH-dependent 2,4-dienoyl-CoA reductase/sulfur reductase-like enzyme n=1 Tax=Microlunatus capsulatus TaxID=99117 RepID=A0ABS4Z308_9ACTN|nr:FAD/NAD(P)-binding oxidoreductase [Microlunatus capsulatus]MBP2415364.1 NADPH-dependent 2,4-dienoyl-CoA reductase/sulfur reductase-like enzyme [Microlunatus capsulatus]